MLSSDLPIAKLEEDELNRGSFAESLAKTLVQYSFPSSLTIGLYGEWGSGKTSLLNMVFENVEQIFRLINGLEIPEHFERRK